jgi:pimeloyl-ACP methyl ester carboxylesterase
MTEYADRFWSSRDGLKLHYRDYPGREDRPPVICLPGLTRNARDFAGLAQRIAGDWRVVCVELRGRGDSDYAKETSTYDLRQYIEDVRLLLDEQAIARFVAVGTSLGGLMTMGFATAEPDRIAGALLNDIGPVLEREGLDAIRERVGQGRSFPTWMHAARALEETHGPAFPDYAVTDWLAMAKRLMTLTSSTGRIVFDYDMNIAEPFAAVDPDALPPDLWPGVDALAGRPVALLRGELSTLLSQATFEKMGRRLPQADAVTVPRVGHAPTLDEPEAVSALDRLLARIVG